jgi:hypothetical protein
MRRAWPAALGLAVLLAACQPGLDAAAPAARDPSLPQVSIEQPAERSGGVARVAVPAQPAGGLPFDELDVAGADLLALWGLPLYRVDGSGLPRPALVQAVEVSADGMRVELDLRSGSWSDGEPVTGRDLAATVDEVRGLGDPGEQLAWLDEVEVDDADPSQVTLHLAQPTRRWPALLSSTGVLPAHVLADTPLEEWESPPPVVGGPFVPVASQAGLGWSFEAHAEGPLGPPALDGLEVLVVPIFDTAVGLLGRGELDAVVGHLAIRPHLRIELLEDDERFTVAPAELEVAAPHGGTQIVLRFSPEGVLGGPAQLRRDVRAVADVRHLVEGLGAGIAVSEELPHATEPDEDTPEDLAGMDAAMVASSEQEVPVEIARLLEAQVRGQEGSLRVEGEPSPHDVRRADDLDLSLVVRRTWNDPDLRPYLPSGELDRALAAESVPGRRDAAVEEAWLRAAEHAIEVPLVQARVTHVWHERLGGIEPSAWPGVGLASAYRWRLEDEG